MKMHWLAAVAVCSAVWPGMAAAATATVKVDGGLVRGVDADEIGRASCRERV